MEIGLNFANSIPNIYTFVEDMTWRCQNSNVIWIFLSSRNADEHIKSVILQT